MSRATQLMIGELGSGTEAVGQLEDGTLGRALTL